jgi:hypothetical protein
MGASSKAERQVDDWVSLVVAARELDEPREAVLRLAIQGELVAQVVAGRVVFTRDSIDRVIASRTVTV